MGRLNVEVEGQGGGGWLQLPQFFGNFEVTEKKVFSPPPL